MAVWAAGLAVVGWIPFVGVAPGMAVTLGRRVLRRVRGDEQPAWTRWLGGFGIAGGLLGLGWPLYFGYYAGYCPGSPGSVVSGSSGSVALWWLMVVATFAGPPMLGYLGMGSILRERWSLRRRSLTGGLVILVGAAASLWALFLTGLAGMGECF